MSTDDGVDLVVEDRKSLRISVECEPVVRMLGGPALVVGGAWPQVTCDLVQFCSVVRYTLAAEFLDEAFGPDGHDEGSESWMP